MNLQVLSCAVVLVSFNAMAATCTWIAEDGDWSVPENWKEGAKPGPDDYVVFPSSGSRTINVDIEGGVRIGRIQSDNVGGTGTNTLIGATISLSGQVATIIRAPFEINTPLSLTYSGEQILQSSASVTFSAPITIAATVSAVHFRNVQNLDDGGPFRFNSTVSGSHATINCQSGIIIGEGANFEVARLRSSLEYTEKSVDIYAAGMALPCYQIGRGTTRIYSANAMPKAVIRPGWYLETLRMGSGSLYIRHDQTFDRFDDNDSGKGIVAWDANKSAHYIVQEEREIAITLNGTADGNSPICLYGTTSVIWNPTNDFTQSFSNRTHTMTGTLTVNRGAIKMVGTTSFAKVPTITVADGASFINESTVAESLKGLKTLTLGENARFSIGEAAATPIAGLNRVTLGLGAKLALPEGCVLAAALLTVDGSYPVPGTYTGAAGAPGATQVDWIEGAGTVSVINSNTTSWKAATSGDWNDAANWTAGVPTADTVVSIAARGADYTVDLTDDAVWPADLTLEKPNATLRAGSGVDLVYDQPSKSSRVVIGNGAKFQVNGGSVAFTNFYGTFTVEGTAAATSSIEVVSGTFLFGAKDTNSRMNVKPGSEIRPKGGTFVNLYRGVDSMNFTGGRIAASSGSYKVRRIADIGYGIFYYNAGDHVFGGTSAQTSTSTYDFDMIMDPQVGTTASLTFRGQAGLNGSWSRVRLGNAGGGCAILNLESEATHNRFAYLMQIGSNLGYGEMNMSAGMLPVGNRGLEIGSSVSKCIGGVKGVFNFSGGTVVYDNTDLPGWSDTGRPLGFSVGYGGMTTATSGQPFVGTFNFSDGTFNNGCGHTLVGLGYAKGTWKQTGGTYKNLYSGANFGRGMIGGFGGEGCLEMSGGTFDFKSDMYVGGAGTDVLVKGDAFAAQGLPVARHDAKGTFKFSNGTVVFRSNLVLGADGRGTLERDGAEGSFSVEGNLVLSNTVENAASGATLKFVYDDADGVKPIDVAGKLVIRDGAKIEVDLGDYGTGEAYRSKRYLVKPAGGVEGDFASVAVSVTGAREKDAGVRCDASGVYASIPRGAMIVVR